MIDRSERIKKLKEFYVLETFQVAYYEAQSSSTIDPYYNRAFAKMVQIESGHAQYFAQKIRELNEDVPVVNGSLFELAGRILGESVELTGPLNTCKLGVKLEKKAMAKYQELIAETQDDPELNGTLMDYLLDEEFHTLWIESYMKRLTP